MKYNYTYHRFTPLLRVDVMNHANFEQIILGLERSQSLKCWERDSSDRLLGQVARLYQPRRHVICNIIIISGLRKHERCHNFGIHLRFQNLLRALLQILPSARESAKRYENAIKVYISSAPSNREQTWRVSTPNHFRPVERAP
jgi:hypothetical protein